MSSPAAGSGGSAAGAPAIDAAVGVPTAGSSVERGDSGTAESDAAVGVMTDAGSLELPVPTAACGTDLDVNNGTVRPDLGEVPAPSAVTLVPSDKGALSVTTQALTIPIRAATVTAAGMSIAVTAGTLPATAYLPSGAGPFPLVVVLPGFQTSYTSYSGFSEHLASHGFLCVGIDTRSNALMASHDTEAVEITQAIDFALSTESGLASKLDATKIAVAGHSKGGKVAFFAAALDPRIDLVVGWDPVNAGGGPCAFDMNCNALPVAPNCSVKDSGLEHLMHAESLVIGAPPDPNLNPEPNHNAENFYRGAPSPAWYVKLNAGHIDWVQGLTARPDVLRITKAVHTAMLLTRFYGHTGLEGYLPQGAVTQAEALVTDTRHK